ncbi:MAG: ANTAR domain-containing protein [Bacillota bacterium]|nr:ANTAR domain-containing protein [Bacillota bacterium]
MHSHRLIITASDSNYRTQLKQLFVQAGYVIVGESDSYTNTLRLVQSRKPDLIVIDGETSDMNIMELLHVIESDKIAPAVILTSKLQRHIVNKAKQSSFCSYILKPVAGPVLLSAIEVALANFDRILQMEQEIEKLKNTLETRKAVDKAKGILMQQLHVSEEEAYRRIRKKSMDKCISMKEVAESIVLAYE